MYNIYISKKSLIDLTQNLENYFTYEAEIWQVGSLYVRDVR